MTRRLRLKRLRHIREVKDEIKTEKNVGRKRRLLLEVKGVNRYSYSNECGKVEMVTGHEFTSFSTSFSFCESYAINELIDMIYLTFIKSYLSYYSKTSKK